MSKLKQTIEVKCPMYYALHHAQRYFTVHRRDVVPGTISLQVNLASLNLPGSGQARHDVRVKHELLSEPGESGALAISWDPQDRTVPTFAGKLHCTERDDGNAILVLEGTYKPPLGLAGRLSISSSVGELPRRRSERCWKT